AYRRCDRARQAAGDRVRDATVLHQPRVRPGGGHREDTHPDLPRSGRLRPPGNLGKRHAPEAFSDGRGVEPALRTVDLCRGRPRLRPGPLRRHPDAAGAGGRAGARAGPPAAVAGGAARAILTVRGPAPALLGLMLLSCVVTRPAAAAV